MFQSNRRARDLARLRTLADPAAAEAARLKAEGDLLERVGVRSGVGFLGGAILLAIAGGMFVGELAFAYGAGVAVFPWLVWKRIDLLVLRADNFQWGGLLTCFNSVAFVLLVWEYKKALTPVAKDPKKWLQLGPWVQEYRTNPIAPWMTLSFILALASSYVSQTTTADAVRQVVDRRMVLEARIAAVPADQAAQQKIVDRRPAIEVDRNRALDQAVGAHASELPEAEADKQCADRKTVRDRRECRTALLRDAVYCAQDISATARRACEDIAYADAQLADVRTAEAQLVSLGKELADKQADLKALPEASNAAIRQLAQFTGWAVPDAQSRAYIFLSLFFLLMPAGIFARLL